jgi:NADPH:quinone reductase-like Zn-dependent oxidoreductase
MPTARILVAKDNLRAVTVDPSPSVELPDGQARLQLDLFSLTANNVTYAAMGQSFRYWDFFPAPDGFGLVPVWGYANVVESRVEGLAVGERLWGYYPFATSVIVTPARLTERGFVDGAVHRQPLPPVYNQYERVAADPSYSAADEALVALFRPLFITSFVIDDWLSEQPPGDAKTVAFAAASSKTALGAAALLKARGQAKIVALTSKANAAFCAETGYYDRVVSYDELTTLPRDEALALVDMAGDAKVINALADHLGDAFVYNMMVGAAHWEDASRQTRGPERTLFFAPDRIVQRTKDWGREGFAARYQAAWQGFRAGLGWLKVEELKGPMALAAGWLRLVDGGVAPRLGLIGRF